MDHELRHAGGLFEQDRAAAPPRFSARGGDFADFERHARQLRAEAMAQAVVALPAGLKALWRRIGRSWSAGLLARSTAGELRLLSDRVLKDIGLRRDQIDCFSKRIPC